MLFISHSTIDKEYALDLQRRLRERGYACEQQFLDSDQRAGIKLGEKWEACIYSNLRDCRALLVLCSSNWLASKWCFAELASAKMSGKQIFPIVIEDCDRSALSEFQCVFVNQPNPVDREPGYERLLLDLDSHGLGPTDNLPWPNPDLRDASGQIDPCPFPGLPAFDERYAAVYFGREKETQLALEELRKMRSRGEPRFLMIVGGSGSGKSSLLMAAVLPRLKHMTSQKEWLVLSTLRFARRDGEDALFQSLADDILAKYPKESGQHGISIPDRSQLIQRFANPDSKSAARSFLDAVRDLTLACPFPDATVLLPIDQFEEFLMVRSDTRSAKFLSFLQLVCQDSDDRMLAIGTMRSDYLDSYELNPFGLKAPKFRAWRLEPFPSEQIPNVIIKPAERAHVTVNADLLDRLKIDTPSTDALPLLAFTLERLFREFAADKVLELKEYLLLGGMEGSIVQTADRIMSAKGASAEIESAVRLTFVTQLAKINDKGDFVRQTARWSAVPSAAKPILEDFVAQRLLVKSERDGEVRIEVAHEAIFRCWPPLVRWLATSADIMRWRSDVARDQQSAIGSGQKWNGLTKPQYNTASRWPLQRQSELSEEERTWIRKAAIQFRYVPFVWWISITLLLLLLVWTIDRARQAITEKKEIVLENLKAFTSPVQIAGNLAAAVTRKDRTAVINYIAALSSEKNRVTQTESVETARAEIFDRFAKWNDKENISSYNTRDSTGYDLRKAALEYAEAIRVEWSEQNTGPKTQTIVRELVNKPATDRTIRVTTQIAEGTLNKDTRDEFERLYWSELVFFEETGISDAMIEFRKLIPDRDIDDPSQLQEPVKTQLKAAAKIVAEKCAEEIAKRDNHGG